MRSKTQERIEELARERAAASVDLGLVEEGIEIGKRMMAEMIATYTPPAKPSGTVTSSARAESDRRDYLNEVSPLTARSASDERH